MTSKIFPCLGLVFFLSLTASEAAFIIQLKDGGEYRTSRYWYEGEEIRFLICGGMLGVPKKEVRDIRKEPALEGRDLDQDPAQNQCASPTKPARKEPEEKLTQDPRVEEDAPSETYTSYAKAIEAFKDKLQGLNGKSTEELVQLFREGEDLKEQLLAETMKDPPAPEVTPLLSKLDEAFDRIEEILGERKGL